LKGPSPATGPIERLFMLPHGAVLAMLSPKTALRAYPCTAGLLAVLLPLLTFAAAAPAKTIPTGPDLAAAGWRTLGVRGKPGNRFVGHPDGVIEVVSSSSVSRLYRPIDIDLGATPVLTWRWRVDKPVPPTDLARKGEDDTAITLYVGFPWDPGAASFTDRLTRPLVEAYAGGDAPGRVLAYVSGGVQQRGEVVASPHLGSAGFMRVLRPAHSPTGEWFEERVDIVAEYREAFGEDPPNPVQIAISADTDDTRSSSRGFIAGLAFVGRGETATPVTD
jgi:hypothetical protein